MILPHHLYEIGFTNAKKLLAVSMACGPVKFMTSGDYTLKVHFLNYNVSLIGALAAKTLFNRTVLNAFIFSLES